MPNSNENIHDNLAEPKRKPGIIKKAGAALVAAGVLGGGAAVVKASSGDGAPKKPEAVPVTTVVSTTAPEREMPPLPEAHPGRVDDGVLPGPHNEPGEPDVPGAGPEVGGSAANLEMALTPEQNEQFRAKAVELSASIIDLYQQGVGVGNAITENQEAGTQTLRVENTDIDGNGRYQFNVVLPMGSMDPNQVQYVSASMSKYDPSEPAGGSRVLYDFVAQEADDKQWTVERHADMEFTVPEVDEPSSDEAMRKFQEASLVIQLGGHGAPITFNSGE